MRNLKDKVQNWLGITSSRLQVMNHHRGFTLIELIVVMAIISILAGLTMPALHRARATAREARARAMIASLGIALSMYETDFGMYPTTRSGVFFNFYQYEILSLLTGRGPINWNINTVITNNPQWHGPYLLVRQEDVRQIRQSSTVTNYRYHLVDPWGTPYVISVALDRNHLTRPWHNTFGVDIYSLGPDRITYGDQAYEYQVDATDLTDHEEDGHSYGTGSANPRYDDINNW